MKTGMRARRAAARTAFAHQAEGFRHRLQATPSRQVRRMHRMIGAIDAHPRTVRIGDQAKHMRRPPSCLVRVRDCLQGGRRDTDNQVVGSPGDLLGDGVGRSKIDFRIETVDFDAASLHVPAVRERLQNTRHTIVRRRDGSVLDQGNPLDAAWLRGSRGATPRAIHQKQYTRTQDEQDRREAQPS